MLRCDNSPMIVERNVPLQPLNSFGIAARAAQLVRVRSEFETLKIGMSHSPTDIGAFIDLHLMILSDPELSEIPKHIIRERRCNAEWAIVQQMENLVAQFEQIDDI